jgi:spore coat polysaccharide biosynthesis protein SpsF
MIVATIEARMTSARLPGKMMLPLGDNSVLGHLIRRLKHVNALNEIVLATTTNATDDVLAGVAAREGIKVYRGSENDVLSRVRYALDQVSADICVEITGDCPLIDPAMVSTMIEEFQRTRGTNSYVANTTGPEPGAPHGLDVQVFEAKALRRIADSIHDAETREHVSLPFYRDPESNPWKPRFVQFFPPEVCRSVWLSLDYREDYELIRALHDELGATADIYGAAAMIDFCRARPKMSQACLALRGM